MVEITFLGGTREVGRMGILLETSGKRILWEYGVNVQTMDVPKKAELPLDAVFVTHAHLDHSGYLPALYKEGYEGSVCATSVTFDLMSLLLRDALKVQSKRGLKLLFMPHDIEKMERLKRIVRFGEEIEIDDALITVHNAGHIPGAVSFVLEAEGKRILYTGDIKFLDTRLVSGAELHFKDIDIVITECTYSYKNHPDREKLIDRIREIAQETVYNNGILLLPCFAVGRTQELLINLYDLGLPIYLDGMGIDATEIILNHPEYIKNPSELRKAFSKARKVVRPKDRNEAVRNACIIITTAGMMNGGPISFYMKKLHNKENCSLVTTGYMVEGTVGRTLMDTGRYIADGLDVRPKMHMEFLDLSAHTDHDHIVRFLEKLSPEKIFLVHGEYNPEFEKELKSMGFDAYSPEMGEKVRV